LETYRQLAARGIGSVGLNFRSCGGELNRVPRLYHSGETEDVRFVVAWLQDRFPDRTLGAIGFSLGGNVLLKYLGEEEESGQKGEGIRAAAAISVPYDLSAGADYLESGFARVYAWRLLRSLRAKTRAKADLVRSLIEYKRALRARTFREFDDAATAPLHGFDGVEDYYTRSSSKHYLRTISVPTRLIHAADDPFLPASAIPYQRVKANPYLQTHFTECGGHVGFVEGSPWSRHYWAESTAAEFLATQLVDSAPSASPASSASPPS
jgi:predicted alpha/beta-fold hydrolase